MRYLGYEINYEGLRPGDAKVKAVKKFPVPQNVRNVRQFIGLASFFRKFVQNFAQIAKPLTTLTRKNENFRWEKEQEESFQKLKDLLTRKPVLTIYEPKAETEVHTDASKIGLGEFYFKKLGINFIQLLITAGKRPTMSQNITHMNWKP